MQMMKIERYKERVDNMLFRASFTEKHQQLSRVNSFCLEIDYYNSKLCRLIIEYELCVRSIYCTERVKFFQGTFEGKTS